MSAFLAKRVKLKVPKSYGVGVLCGWAVWLAACQAQPETAEITPPDLAPVEVTVDESALQNITVLDAKAKLSVLNAHIKPPLPGRDVSAIYFTLVNAGEEDRLIGVQTTLSEHAEIHTHIKVGNIMKMRRIEDLTLPYRSSVVFKPGSYHIMVFGTELSPVATDAEMTLVFENAGAKTLTVPIKGRTRSVYKSDDAAIEPSK